MLPIIFLVKPLMQNSCKSSAAICNSHHIKTVSIKQFTAKMPFMQSRHSGWSLFCRVRLLANSIRRRLSCHYEPLEVAISMVQLTGALPRTRAMLLFGLSGHRTARTGPSWSQAISKAQVQASCKFNLNASSLALPPFARDKFSNDTGANIRFKGGLETSTTGTSWSFR